jgi:hypothetical protein
MQTNILYQPDFAKIVISPDSDLTELSFSIESVLANFVGRGCASFEFTRSTQPDKSCIIEAKALEKCGPMILSKVGNIGYAVQSGTYPRILTRSFLTEVQQNREPVIREGQNRLAKYFASLKSENFIESVVCSYDFDPKVPLSHITYGLSDMFTGLFAKGVTYLKWQGSMKESQLYVRHKFPEKELHAYLMASQDYELRRKVSTL